MVIFCIGSPDICGDSVAPLVGDMLIESSVEAHVYGTTTRPITATNYHDYYQFVAIMHQNEPIIAIDASLGAACDIGCIKVIRGGVCPGKAVGKELPPIGTLSFLALVGEYTSSALATLMAVPYDDVLNMASRVTRLILSVVDN